MDSSQRYPGSRPVTGLPPDLAQHARLLCESGEPDGIRTRTDEVEGLGAWPVCIPVRGASYGIRTRDLWIDNPALSPAKLTRLQIELVYREGIEPPPRGSSTHRSTELSYRYEIVANSVSSPAHVTKAGATKRVAHERRPCSQCITGCTLPHLFTRAFRRPTTTHGITRSTLEKSVLQPGAQKSPGWTNLPGLCRSSGRFASSAFRVYAEALRSWTCPRPRQRHCQRLLRNTMANARAHREALQPVPRLVKIIRLTAC